MRNLLICELAMAFMAAFLLQRPSSDHLAGGSRYDRMGEVGPAWLVDGNGHVDLEVRDWLTLTERRQQVDAAKATDVVPKQAAAAGKERDTELRQLPPAVYDQSSQQG
jgi:hypothetical protein